MSQGSRPRRVGDQIRSEISQMLLRDIHDPGVGFVTLTHVDVSPDLQLARVYFTSLGNEQARQNSARALARATPYFRRQLGRLLRLRRTPELEFIFDHAIEGQDRIEQLLRDIHREKAASDTPDASHGAEDTDDKDNPDA